MQKLFAHNNSLVQQVQRDIKGLVECKVRLPAGPDFQALIGEVGLAGAKARRVQENDPVIANTEVRLVCPFDGAATIRARCMCDRPDIAADKPGGMDSPEYEAFEECKDGGVLVISSVGPWESVGGDIKFLRLKQLGCGGIVTDGSVRDTNTMLEYGFPVYSYSTTAKQGPAAMQPWEANGVIECGGVVVRPGDAIVASRENMPFKGHIGGDADAVAPAKCAIARASDAIPEMVGSTCASGASSQARTASTAAAV